MAMFVFQAYLYAADKYPDKKFSEMILDMFWTEGWLLSMVFLNIGSIIWAISLVKFQLNVVARGQTTYFQQKVSTLTSIDKLYNVIYFLQGKPVYVTDIEMTETPKYPVQKGYPTQENYPVQNV